MNILTYSRSYMMGNDVISVINLFIFIPGQQVRDSTKKMFLFLVFGVVCFPRWEIPTEKQVLCDFTWPTSEPHEPPMSLPCIVPLK